MSSPLDKATSKPQERSPAETQATPRKGSFLSRLFTKGSLSKEGEVGRSTLEKTQWQTTKSLDPLQKTLEGEKSFSREQLSETYGNKAANLYILNQLCQKIEGVNAKVPSFLGISHNDVLKVLKKRYKKFDKDWKKFLSIQEGKKALTPQGKEKLEEIRTNILMAFAKGSLNIDSVKNFLNTSTAPLMVRSTGVEDTKKGAMAGANKSVAGVEPKEEDILNAVGTVVASYFSGESFAQRILAGKEITESPFMPVLLQVMIGESSDSDEILSCGVCYTREMGGETPNLTMIEAAYGHNEGVVNGNVRTDVYYVYPEGNSHEVIAPKTDRLIPQKAEKGEDHFVRQNNPSDIASKPALSSSAQQKLQKISEAIHDEYGQPMDIEWVYSPRTDTFFIVQARPIKEMQQKPARTIDESKLHQVGGVLQKADKIVGRGGRNTIVTQPNQVIKAKTLDDALYQYLAIDQECRKEDRENPVQVVVVDRSDGGGELSHAGCIFQENGIVAFRAPFYSTKGLKQEKAHIFDLQGSEIGEISIPPGTEDPEKYLEEIGVLKEGWKKHTIPGTESVKTLEIVKEEYDALLKDYSPDLPENLTMGELLDNIASPNPEISTKAVKDLAFILRRRIERVSKLSDPASQAALPRLKRLFNNIVVIAKDVVNRPEAMQRLHAAKRIEAMMTQEASPFVINSDSFIAALAELKGGQGIAIPQSGLDEANQGLLRNLEAKTASALKGQHLEKLFNPMTDEEKYSCLFVYRALSKYALTEETKAAWQQLTDQVAASGSKTANRFLIDMVVRLDELGVLADWMNDNFAKMSSDGELLKNPIFLLRGLRREFSGIKPMMKELSEFQSAVNTWSENYGAWEDPQAFDVLWLQFESSVLKPLAEKSQRFLENKQILSSLEKRIFLKVILQGVDAVDKSIKVMKGSPRYEDQISLKVERFGKMLTPYCDLMLLWFDAIPEEDFRKWTAGVVAADQMSTAEYRQKMREGIKSKFNASKESNSQLMLYPSSEFNMQITKVNSGVDFGPHFLNKDITLEDCFTLFHQNILAAMAPHQELIDSSKVPPIMTAILSDLGSIDTSYRVHRTDVGIKSQVLEVNPGFPVLSAKINIPIKYHAAVLDVAYDLRTEEALVTFQMFGHNLGNRMQILAKKAILSLCQIDGTFFEDVPEYRNVSSTLSFSIKLLKDFKDFKALSSMVQDLCKDSLAGNFAEILVPRVGDLLRDPEMLGRLIEKRQYLEACSHSDPRFISDVFHGLIVDKRYDEAIKLMQAFGIDVKELNQNNFIELLPKLILQEIEKGTSLKTLQSLVEGLFRPSAKEEVGLTASLFIAEFMKNDWKSRLTRLVEKSADEPTDWLTKALIRGLIKEGDHDSLDSVLVILEKRISELNNVMSSLKGSPKHLENCQAILQKNRFPGFGVLKEDIGRGMDAKSFDKLQKGAKVIYLYQEYKSLEPQWIYATVVNVEAFGKKSAKLSLGDKGTVMIRDLQAELIKIIE